MKIQESHSFTSCRKGGAIFVKLIIDQGLGISFVGWVNVPHAMVGVFPRIVLGKRFLGHGQHVCRCSEGNIRGSVPGCRGGL